MNTPYTIYITYTYRSIYASQGMSPSNKEGYDIWIDEDGMMIFLGWIPLDDITKTLLYYMDQDDCTIALRDKNMPAHMIIDNG